MVQMLNGHDTKILSFQATAGLFYLFILSKLQG